MQWNLWSLFDFESNTGLQIPSALRSRRLDAELAFAEQYRSKSHRCMQHRSYPDSHDFCRGEPEQYCETAHSHVQRRIAVDRDMQDAATAAGLVPFRKTTKRRWGKG